MPLIFNDQQAIGRMAAEHLLERGFTQFGYIGQRGGFWSDGRRDGFAAAVVEAGYACDEFIGQGRTIEDYRQRVWETETPEVAKWVAQLPKPAGVMGKDVYGEKPLSLTFSCNRYLTYEQPGWQWIREYSGGLLTNWGAHGLDMVQWALGTDDTGPVEITREGKGPDSRVSYRYANGVVLRLGDAGHEVLGGGHFIGAQGELIMNRGKFLGVHYSKHATRHHRLGIRKMADSHAGCRGMEQ